MGGSDSRLSPVGEYSEYVKEFLDTIIKYKILNETFTA
jgi:hypothetical protein